MRHRSPLLRFRFLTPSVFGGSSLYRGPYCARLFALRLPRWWIAQIEEKPYSKSYLGVLVLSQWVFVLDVTWGLGVGLTLGSNIILISSKVVGYLGRPKWNPKWRPNGTAVLHTAFYSLFIYQSQLQIDGRDVSLNLRLKTGKGAKKGHPPPPSKPAVTYRAEHIVSIWKISYESPY